MLLLVILPSLIATFQQPLQLSSAQATPARDSARVRRRAERAQTTFELRRRNALPVSYAGSRGACDVRIGRFCYWREDDEPEARPPEPERITSARRSLLATLDSAAALLPGDDWIVGQRVRYLIDGDDAAGAARALSDCAATGWWCDALAGLAHHLMGDDRGADSAFAHALAAMPDDEHCAWSDLSVIGQDYPDALRRCASRDDAVRRDSAAARLWWLAQPLYLLPANDLRAEYLARRTMARLERMARGAYATSWGSDAEQLLLRFGWPTWWTRNPPRIGMLDDRPAISGHERSPGWDFLPAPRLVDSTDAPPLDDDWELERRPGRMVYAPLYARVLHPLVAQIARFRRGDSLLVVARWTLDRASRALLDTLRDTLASAVRPALAEAGDTTTRGYDVALALGRDEHTLMAVARGDTAAPEGMLRCMAGWSPRIAGVELLDARRRFAARERVAMVPEPDSGFAISDLLLFHPDTALRESLDDVLPVALPALVARAGDRIGVYWESYALPPRATVSVTLTLERVRERWAARLAERLHLRTRTGPLHLRWQEAALPDGHAARVLTIDLSGLAGGRYRLLLAQRLSDGRTASRERELEIVD